MHSYLAAHLGIKSTCFHTAHHEYCATTSPHHQPPFLSGDRLFLTPPAHSAPSLNYLTCPRGHDLVQVATPSGRWGMCYSKGYRRGCAARDSGVQRCGDIRRHCGPGMHIQECLAANQGERSWWADHHRTRDRSSTVDLEERGWGASRLRVEECGARGSSRSGSRGFGSA
jgi:hypothetical protein